MKTVILFETSTAPGKINIDHFINDIVAFYECSSLEPMRYLFYYNGTAENIGFLSTIGFQDIKSLREVSVSDPTESINWNGRTKCQKIEIKDNE
jgi:hypothetical protein